MNSSATASYSWSGVWRAKTFPEGKQIVATIRMQPKNCFKRSFTTAAQLYTTLCPLPKILDERISDRSQTQSKMKRRFVIGAFGLLVLAFLSGIGFRSLRAADQDEDNGYSQIAMFAKAL